jgi:hypothetical protein
VQQWRQQFDKLESVDLRYDGQIIVNPDLEGMARQPALTPAAAKMAMAAGVKTAAIVNYEKYVTQPVPATPAKKEAKPKAKVRTKVAVHYALKQAQAKQAPAKHASAKPFPAKPAPVRQAPVNQAPANHAALKPKEKRATVAVAKSRAAPHPVASTSSARQKKPSAGIPKESPQN